MIISHKHKFIFIKTRKTAGTSVEIALSEFCGENDIITPISEKDEKARISLGFPPAQNYLLEKKYHSRFEWYGQRINNSRKQFYNHIPAFAVRKFIDENIWNSYFKFTIERNPYDKAMSLFHYLGGLNKYKSLEDFLKSGLLVGCTDFEKYSKGGVLMVDKVMDYGNLNHELEEVGIQIGLNKTLSLPDYRAKSNYRKDSAHYSELINEEAKQIIEVAFAREIQKFGYTF